MQSVHEAFRAFDDDGSGSINASELKMALQHMGLELSSAEVDSMMATADKDGDGEIDLEEFEGMMDATAEGAAAWAKIRAASNKNGAPPGELALGAVLQCVEVNKWLVAEGLAGEADVLLRSFAEAGYPIEEWLPELRSMDPDELQELAAAARSNPARGTNGSHGRKRAEPARAPPPSPASPPLSPQPTREMPPPAAGVGVMLEDTI